MASSTTSAADAIVKSADKAGENTAKSAFDSTFSNFDLPEDPSAIGKSYGKASSDLYTGLDIGGSLQRNNDLASESGLADAAAVFESRYMQEALGKTPVGELDQEIERLSAQRWGIVPSILARTDIIDYGEKLRIAGRAESLLDTQITRLTDSRDRLVKGAESRAKNKVEGLKAQAALLDKQTEAAKLDLTTRIDLWKEGNATFDDIVQAAMALKKMQDDASGSGDGNPFIGTGGESNFTPAEVSAFQYFEAFGDWPVTDSSKLQLKQQLTTKYSQWVSAGKPGTKNTTIKNGTPILDSAGTGAGYYDAMNDPSRAPVTEEVPNPYSSVADNQTNSAQKKLMEFLTGAQP